MISFSETVSTFFEAGRSLILVNLNGDDRIRVFELLSSIGTVESSSLSNFMKCPTESVDVVRDSRLNGGGEMSRFNDEDVGRLSFIRLAGRSDILY